MFEHLRCKLGESVYVFQLSQQSCYIVLSNFYHEVNEVLKQSTTAESEFSEQLRSQLTHPADPLFLSQNSNVCSCLVHHLLPFPLTNSTNATSYRHASHEGQHAIYESTVSIT